jgi:5-methylcytosine-specific restriction endonuclease McrA
MEKTCGRCPTILPEGWKHRWCVACCREYNRRRYQEKCSVAARGPVVKPCRRCGTSTEIRGKQYYCKTCGPIVKAELHREANRRVNDRIAANGTRCTLCKAEIPPGKKTYYCATCSLAWSRHWNSTHPEQLRDRGRRWRAENAEQNRQNYQNWREQNREQYLASKRANQARRTHWMTTGDATGADYQEVLSQARGCCAICGKQVGGNLHVDHIIPLSRGGLHTRSNLQAACPPCNIRKYNKLPGELTRRDQVDPPTR